MSGQPSLLKSAQTTPRPGDGRSNSCRFGHILECSVTAIMEETRRHRLVHFRRAIISLACRRIALLTSFRREVQIVRYEKIKAPIAVIINPRGAGAPTRVIDPGLDGDIGEGPVAVVVIENIMSEVCDVQVTNFGQDRKSTRLNSSHLVISYAVFCLKKKK